MPQSREGPFVWALMPSCPKQDVAHSPISSNLPRTTFRSAETRSIAAGEIEYQYRPRTAYKTGMSGVSN